MKNRVFNVALSSAATTKIEGGEEKKSDVRVARAARDKSSSGKTNSHKQFFVAIFLTAGTNISDNRRERGDHS